MFSVVQSDLFSADDIDILCHGCNCFNTMGAGVANIIRKEYPGAYKEDCKTVSGDKNKLGTYTKWVGSHKKIQNKSICILNCYTQYNIGFGEANYTAIKKVMEKIKEDFPHRRIGMPFIGAGLAGGDPKTIHDIIKNIFVNDEHTSARIYVLPGQFEEFITK